MRVVPILTLAAVVTAVLAGAASAETYTPPWFSWVESLPWDVKKYAVMESNIVNLDYWGLPKWVRAAKYIVYVAPKYNLPADPDTVYRVGEGSQIFPKSRKIREYIDWGARAKVYVYEERYYVNVGGREGDLSCPVDSVPKWGRLKWRDVRGAVPESVFANWVLNMSLNRGKPIEQDDLFKAAVRVAYWVASWIPFEYYYDFRSGGHPELVLREWRRKWNCGDHAVLAAALMRALGIPVKIVLGKLWVPEYGRWVGHYWLQFYAKPGTWVDIDPNGGMDGRWWYSQSNPHRGYSSTDVEAQYSPRTGFSFGDLRACWESPGNELKPRVYEVRKSPNPWTVALAAMLLVSIMRRFRRG
ncbi:transglutaminase-like domain-containing protein [Methanopyrus sp.]